jgi:hypothetical protein
MFGLPAISAGDPNHRAVPVTSDTSDTLSVLSSFDTRAGAVPGHNGQDALRIHLPDMPPAILW